MAAKIIQTDSAPFKAVELDSIALDIIEKAIDVADVRAALTAGGFDKAVVQTFGGTNDFAIRIVSDENASSTTEEASAVANDKIAANVLKALQAKRPDAKVTSSEFVGAQVGDELRNDGLVAVIFVIAGISIYLWIRFEWRFAVSAVASELHDTLLTVLRHGTPGRRNPPPPHRPSHRPD